MRFDTETVTPGLICVECDHAMNRGRGPGTPGPGDFSLCIRCGSLNVFEQQMRFRRPTDAEMLEAAADREIQAIRRAIYQAREMADRIRKDGP